MGEGGFVSNIMWTIVGDRPKNEPITRTVRNFKPSNKIKIGGYLSRIDWSILHTVNTIEGKVQLFEDLILTGINIIAPEKIIKIHSNDAPWMTADLKSQIKNVKKVSLREIDQSLFFIEISLIAVHLNVGGMKLKRFVVIPHCHRLTFLHHLMLLLVWIACLLMKWPR